MTHKSRGLARTSPEGGVAALQNRRKEAMGYMLALNDDRWKCLTRGYRVAVDVRPLLCRIESGDDQAWPELWQELYHQGDVGEASFAAVPHLVRINKQRGVADWNTYAIVASIELRRGVGRNPDVPEWTREAYEAALRELAELGASELPRADALAVRSILALLAIVYGARTCGRILCEFTEDEVAELEQRLAEL